MTVSPSTHEVRLLPLLADAPDERRDAARNRRVLLDTAAQLIAEFGAAALTMETWPDAPASAKEPCSDVSAPARG